VTAPGAETASGKGAASAPPDPDRAATALFSFLDGSGARIVLAESCTGGLAAAALTGIPGSSRVLWGGIVSYTEEAKTAVLGIPQAAIDEFGVVSVETAAAMARGALAASCAAKGGAGRGADFAAAVTGYAGPDAPGSEGGPGRVCFAWASRDGALRTEERRFEGPRHAVRMAACARLLEGALEFCTEERGGERY
jgi:nicotinamide-nucleotide amidase